MLNPAFAIPTKDKLNEAKLKAAAPVLIVKQAEACFRLLPKVNEFDHFTPSAFLIRHLELLDGDAEPVATSLDRFEAIFKKLNPLI